MTTLPNNNCTMTRCSYHRRHYNHPNLPLLFILIIMTFCCLAQPVHGRSHDKEGKRRNDRLAFNSGNSNGQYIVYGSGLTNIGLVSSSSSSSSSFISSKFNGIIDSTGFCARRRDMKLMCYCTPDENHVPVQKAECWIFSDGLLQNDTTWTRFYQQRRLRDLKFVVQNHGRIDYIPTMILESLQNLTSISIEYSQVEIVKSYAFANLPHLERIVLTNNQIMALDQEAFANHIRLRDLNLEHNQIFEIDRNAFRNLPLCERLNLNNNNISNLHDGLFMDLGRLIFLNLAYNQISVLTSEIFKGLGNLNVLNLTHNNINFIGDTVFAELWSLTELQLNDNHIERISERALDGLNNLKILNLRNNLLKKLDNGLLRGTPALLTINVESNQLETLTSYTFQPIMDNLVNSSSELFISDNNFICDCRLQWLYDLKNRTRYQQLRDSLDEFVCTLQDPHLYNFIEPVPTHILDLLNVGGLSGLTNGGILSEQFSNVEAVSGSVGDNIGAGRVIGGVMGRKRMSKARLSNQRHNMMSYGEQMLFKDRDATNLNRDYDLKKKRALSYQNTATNVANSDSSSGNSNTDIVGVTINKKPVVESHYIFGGGSDSVSHINDNSGNVNVAHDYLEESSNDHHLSMQNDLQLFKQNALYQQHNNDVLEIESSPYNNDNHLLPNEVNVLPKQALGFRVRLFILKPELLPCHEQLSDPTELPLSRDLMDARSSNVQILAPSTTSAANLRTLHCIDWCILKVLTLFTAMPAAILRH